jgi:hypothetical protein
MRVVNRHVSSYGPGGDWGSESSPRRGQMRSVGAVPGVGGGSGVGIRCLHAKCACAGRGTATGRNRGDDRRSDCVQVVIPLMMTPEGFAAGL